MSYRLAWLEPLISHLKNDASLSEVGSYVFPMSEYRQINPKNQFSPSFWIIPQDGSIISTKRAQGSFCRSQVRTNILICTVVNNVLACDDHIAHEQGSTSEDMYGAYIEASKLEEKLRDSIISFNKEVVNDPIKYKFDPLELSGMPEPDENNGHFILGQIYQTTFSF